MSLYVARHFGTGGFEPSAARNVQCILRAGRVVSEGESPSLCPLKIQQTLAVEFEPSDGVSRQCLANKRKSPKLRSTAAISGAQIEPASRPGYIRQSFRKDGANEATGSGIHAQESVSSGYGAI